jgi:serine/threonine-protein kinase RsbW
MSATDVRTVELSIPASSRYLLLPRLSLAGIAPVAQLGEETLADLKLAVTEACANAVKHAYPDAVDGEVRIRVQLSSDALTVEVADNGRGIQGDDIEAWDAEQMREEGMGLAIIRAVVDELEIDSTPGQGTVVRFVKRLSAGD